MVLTDEPPLYRDLLRMKPEELTPNAWAVKAGVSRTVWTDMRRHGNPSRRTLEKLLSAAGSTLAEFEALRLGDAPVPHLPASGAGAEEVRAAGWRPAPLPPIPLLEPGRPATWASSGGKIQSMEIDLDRVAGRVERPSSLAADRLAYAVTMTGNAMWPRFRPGRPLLVSPAEPANVGDDILVRLNLPSASGRAIVIIGELVRRTPEFAELRHFNPDVTFKIAAPRIASVHRIAGEAV